MTIYFQEKKIIFRLGMSTILSYCASGGRLLTLSELRERELVKIKKHVGFSPNCSTSDSMFLQIKNGQSKATNIKFLK